MKLEELSKYDGKEGRKAYVAYKDKVYDVTDSKLWKEGQHMRRHAAGEDLTEDMVDAPHSDSVFEQFTVVGDFEPESQNKEKTLKDHLQAFYRKFHPHPMLIHFPVGLLNFAVLMQISFMITGKASYENAALYSLIVGFLSLFPAIASGFFSWWINYNTVLDRIFSVKIVFSFMLVLLVGIELFIRLGNPGLPTEGGQLLNVYTGLMVLNAPVLAIIGYHGGKLTWG